MNSDNKIIQGLWIGPSLSRLEQLSIKSFLANGHEFHLYAYRPVKNVPAGTVIKNAGEILAEAAIFKYHDGPGKGSYAGFANLFRYKLLLDKGSWWADLDMICLKPFDFADPYVFAAQTRKDGTCVNNCCIKAPPKSDLMKSCFDRSSQKDSATLTWGETGPFLMNAEVSRLNLEQFIQPPATFCPIDFRNFTQLMTPGQQPLEKCSAAIHLWQEMWRRKSHEPGRYRLFSAIVNKIRYNRNRRFSQKTILGQLQRRYHV